MGFEKTVKSSDSKVTSSITTDKKNTKKPSLRLLTQEEIDSKRVKAYTYAI